MLLDFLLAGTDTTANTLSFAIGELTNHPELAERLFEEIEAVCGSSNPTIDHLNSLIWTDAIVNETLRLHTIAPMALPHRVVEPIEINGYEIPKNVRFAL